jgi:hypothetical protein
LACLAVCFRFCTFAMVRPKRVVCHANQNAVAVKAHCCARQFSAMDEVERASSEVEYEDVAQLWLVDR